MQIETPSIYDLITSEDKLHGAQVGHGNGEYIQVESGRSVNSVDGTLFPQGPIDFEFDLQTNEWFDPFSAFLKLQVSLTKQGPAYTQLQSIDNIAPAMNSASLLISQFYLYYNETLIDKFDADVLPYVDMINKRQDNTRNTLNFYSQQSNNNLSSSFETRQNTVINTSAFGCESQSIIYQIPLSTFQYSSTQYVPGGRWMLRIIPNQNYKKDYIQSTGADKVPEVDYDVRVQNCEMFVKVVEGPRLSDSTFYINSLEYQKQTYEVFTNNIKNINNTTFYIPENTCRIAAFFRYKGTQDTRYPKTHFIFPNNEQQLLSKFLIKYKGKYGPAPLNFNQDFQSNGFNGNAQLYKLNYSRKDNKEFTPESLEDFSLLRGPYIIADFDENSPIKSNEAQVYYQFTENVTDLELVIICYVKKQFRVILQNNVITRIDNVSGSYMKYDIPKNGFNESLNRPGYYEDDIKPREIDFDQLTLMDIQNAGIKVQLSEKALQNIVNVQIPDPTDTTYQQEGRPQRTSPLGVNIANLAQSALPLGVKINAIRTAVNTNHIETTDEIQGVVGSIMSMISNPDEYNKIKINPTYQNVIDTTISNSLNIPNQPDLFNLYKQYYTINEVNNDFSKFYLFLKSNIPLGRTSQKPLVKISSGEKPSLISLEEFRQMDPSKWGLDIQNRNVIRITNHNKSLFVLASEMSNTPVAPTGYVPSYAPPTVTDESGIPVPPPPPPPRPLAPSQASVRPVGFDEELKNRVANPNLRKISELEDKLGDIKRNINTHLAKWKNKIEPISKTLVNQIPDLEKQERKEIVKSFVNNILNSVVQANTANDAVSEISDVVDEVVSEIPNAQPNTADEATNRFLDLMVDFSEIPQTKQSSSSSITTDYYPNLYSIMQNNLVELQNNVNPTVDYLHKYMMNMSKMIKEGPGFQNIPQNIQKIVDLSQEIIYDHINTFVRSELSKEDKKKLDSLKILVKSKAKSVAENPISKIKADPKLIKDIEKSFIKGLEIMKKSSDFDQIVNTYEKCLENKDKLYSLDISDKEQNKLLETFFTIRRYASTINSNFRKMTDLSPKYKKLSDKLDYMIVYNESPTATKGSGKKKSKKLSLRY